MWARRGSVGLIAALASMGPAAAAASAASWTVQSAPSVAGAAISSLGGISCATTDACIAVGAAGNGGISPATTTLAERWDGVTWSIMPTPNGPGTSSNLTAVSCSHVSKCVAVGSYTTASGGNFTLAERWDGTAWTIMPAPKVMGSLRGVSCTGGDACTAVGMRQSGSDQLSLAERWNGWSWTVQHTPNPPPDAFGDRFGGLNGVDCTSNTFCIAVGSGEPPVAMVWDGTAWRLRYAVEYAIATLGSVSCASPSACTAVGFAIAGPDDIPVAERWNGSGWALQRIVGLGQVNGHPTDFLGGVSCATLARCMTVGSYATGGPGESSGSFAESQLWFGGSDWHPVTTPSPSNATDLAGVSCTAPTRCTAVGAAFDSSSGTYDVLVERYS